MRPPAQAACKRRRRTGLGWLMLHPHRLVWLRSCDLAPSAADLQGVYRGGQCADGARLNWLERHPAPGAAAGPVQPLLCPAC